MSILVGSARCKECGHVAPRDEFGDEIRCLECGAQSVEINPNVVEVKTLNEFGVLQPPIVQKDIPRGIQKSEEELR